MKDDWNTRIRKLKGEWKLKKKKEFRKRLLNWILMIILLGGALYVYLNWM